MTQQGEMNRRLVVGVASFGMSGRIFHLPLLTHHHAFRVKCVVERTRHEALRDYPAVQHVSSFSEMVNDPEIDLIVVNTPDPTHHTLAKQSLEAGKHTVIEKPFTQTVQQGRELIELAQQSRKQLCVFHNRRWDGDFLTVQHLVREKRLGRLVDFEVHWDRYRNYIQPDTWKERFSSGSGLLYNLGSHLIDQALVLFGVPEAVTAHLKTVRTAGEVDDWFEVRLHYPSVQVSLKSSYLVREPGPRYLLHGTLGSYVKYGIDPQELALARGGDPASPDWGKEAEEWWGVLHTEEEGAAVRTKIETAPGNYAAFYDSVHDAIMHGTECGVRPEEALNVIRIIAAAQQSNAQRKTIPLETDRPSADQPRKGNPCI
jgi:scyllo-inositol 2-dehydrogenase (NADP+)